MQQELFSLTLSDYNKYQISISLNSLVAWGQQETQLHIKKAIVEYFNQLKSLLEEDTAYVGNPREAQDNL